MARYTIGGNIGETPDRVKRKRELAAKIMGQGPLIAPRSTLDGLGNAFDAIMGGVAARRMNSDADAAQQAGQESASGLRDQLIASITGGNFPAAPNPGDSTSMATMPATDTASARVAQAHGDNAVPAQSSRFSGGKQEFIDMLMPAAMEASQRTGVDPRIIVAQAAQETGWGRSAPGNNYFGIKSHGKGGGQTFGTHEYVNGKRVNIRDSFRQFGSPDESVAGYADFLQQNPRYKPLMAAQGLDAQLEALQASGYATDPNYSRSVGSIARGISLPNATAANEAMASGQLSGNSALTSEALQQWAFSNYAPDAQNGAVDAVNALGASQPVGVAETPQDILAQEQAMMGQDPLAFQQPDMMMPPQGTQPRLQAPMAAAQQPMPQPMPQAAPPLPDPRMVDDMPVAGIQPQQLAQAGGFPEMAGNNPQAIPAPGPDIGMLLQAASNPWLNDQQRGIVNMMIEQQMQSQDPMRQMQLEKGQLEIEALRNPVEKPTDTQRNLGWRAREAGLRPGTKEYADFMRTGGSQGTNITVNTGEGDKFYENLDKKNAETFSALSEAGVSGRSKMAQIDRLGELLTRAPQGASALLKQAAGEYGINTEGLSDIQAAQALINELVPQQRQPGSGPMSDADLALFKQSLPRLINQPEGNKLILDTMRNITRYQVQMGDIADLVADREISPAEGRKMIRELANPLEGFGGAASELSQSGDIAPGIPEGVDPSDWEFMTPEERRLWQQQ